MRYQFVIVMAVSTLAAPNTAQAQMMKRFGPIPSVSDPYGWYAKNCANRSLPVNGPGTLCDNFLRNAPQYQSVQSSPPRMSFRHRIERTQTGYAVFVTNTGQVAIQCQVSIDAYRWFGNAQQRFADRSAIYVSAGREANVGWNGLQPVGARYSVSDCAAQ